MGQEKKAASAPHEVLTTVTFAEHEVLGETVQALAPALPQAMERKRRAEARLLGSSCWTRTSDPAVNSRLLYRLS